MIIQPIYTPTTNPSSSQMYVLKRSSDTINYKKLRSDIDDENFEWK